MVAKRIDTGRTGVGREQALNNNNNNCEILPRHYNSAPKALESEANTGEDSDGERMANDWEVNGERTTVIEPTRVRASRNAQAEMELSQANATLANGAAEITW